jgi:hypothetical protein
MANDIATARLADETDTLDDDFDDFVFDDEGDEMLEQSQRRILETKRERSARRGFWP